MHVIFYFRGTDYTTIKYCSKEFVLRTRREREGAYLGSTVPHKRYSGVMILATQYPSTRQHFFIISLITYKDERTETKLIKHLFGFTSKYGNSLFQGGWLWALLVFVFVLYSKSVPRPEMKSKEQKNYLYSVPVPM